tara:strand:- start:3441 stop:4835 length:1395 start_codon:yes stop_codon:yes gene_type:complete
MAFQIFDRPLRFVHPAYSKHTIFTVRESSSATVAQSGFKFVFEVRIFTTDENGDSVNDYHRFTVKPNSDGYASFDAGQLIQDYCTTDTEIFTGTTSGSHNGTHASVFPTDRFSIHTVDRYSRQRSNLIKVVVAVYPQYELNGTVFLPFQPLGDDYAFFNGVQPLEQGSTDFDDLKYILNGDTKEFLTNTSPTIERKIRLGDYHTFAFLNGTFKKVGSIISFTSQASSIKTSFFNSSGNAIGSVNTLNNNSANDGLAQSVATIEDEDEIQGSLLYVGVGPGNLVNRGVTIPTNTATYTVQAFDSSGDASSQAYTFRLEDDDCKGFETIRLAYLNRLGGYDYYNFTKKSTRTVDTNKGLMKHNPVHYGNVYASRQNFLGGTGVYRSRSIEIIEANTDFITDDEATALEELFTSPQVYMQDTTQSPDTFLPVVVAEKTYTKQTTANDGLKQYVISIEKSNEKLTQRL